MKKAQITKLTLKKSSVASLKANSVKGGVLLSLNNEPQCLGTGTCETTLFTVFPDIPCF